MRFNYYSEFEDWADKNDYNPEDRYGEETVLQKSYSRIIKFYIMHENGTYAQVKAYSSEEEGLYDIEIQAEGLIRTEEIVEVKRFKYE